MSDDQLTPEQIENWRTLLAMQYNLIPSMIGDAAVQRIRDNYQAAFNFMGRIAEHLRAGGELVWDKSRRQWHVDSRMGEWIINLSARQSTEFLACFKSNLKRTEHQGSNVYRWVEEKSDE